MRKLMLSSVALTALLGSSLSSQAADLGQPVYKSAPPPVAPAFYWTGFYIGSHAGCGWVNTQAPTSFGRDPAEPLVNDFAHSTERAEGCFGGGQIGFNYQFSGNIVFGIEGDASFGKISSFNTTSEDGGTEAVGWESKLSSFGTVRGRLGYAINGGLPWFGGLGWMPYVTGGWAWARNKLSAQGDAGTFTSDTQTLNGWTIGVGLEYAITPYLTWKAEYLFMEFDSKSYAITLDDEPGVLPGANFDRLKVNVIKTGLNWRFGGASGFGGGSGY
jgi:outer membrane immunogenic protein